MTSPCPKCGYALVPQFISCPGCGWDISELVAPTGTEGIEKKLKHNEIIRSGSVSIGTGPGGFNASFDQRGDASLSELIRFTVIFGHRQQISSGPGRQPSDAIITYFPEIIGSGVSKFWSGLKACSGVCIISPANPQWGHPFPAMDEFIYKQGLGKTYTCRECGDPTTLGHPLCFPCYTALGGNWRDLIA